MKKLITQLWYIKKAASIVYQNIIYPKIELKETNSKRIFLLSTPAHANLGDHAIAEAEVKFIKDNFPQYEIIEFYREDILYGLHQIKKVIRKQDIVFIQGGGNMGNQYWLEKVVQMRIIKKLVHNKIIYFPQTIYFTPDKKGNKALNKMRVLCSKHPDLTLTAREKYSYDIMKKEFQHNKVIFTPDIVLYLNQQKPIERKNIFVCLRSDVEGILNENEKLEIIQSIKQQYSIVSIGDTVVSYHINKEKRQEELEKIWNQFRMSKVVITDRLHGMIFSAITGTPCIVLNNYNHKVAGEYEWLKEIPYIKLLNRPKTEEIMIQIEQLCQYSTQNMDVKSFKAFYEVLKKEIE